MIKIAYPWVLISIVLPFIMYYISTRQKASINNDNALKIPFYENLRQTFAGVSYTDEAAKNSHLKYLLATIWILIVIAGSGVQWLGKPISIPQTGRDLLLAIDLSGSMQNQDMEINGQHLNRAEIVKIVADDFVTKRTGDRLGLILFGSRAYLQTPLTFDRNTIKQMIDDATIGIAGPQTAIGDAIGLAIKATIDNPSKSKALVLLTDGSNNSGVLDPIKAAEMAHEAGLKIYTIGIGASQMAVPSMFGTQIVNPSADLDLEALKKISDITGGRFYRAEDGNQLAEIYNIINQLEPTKSDELTIRPVSELYPWILGLALILSFIAIALTIWRKKDAS
ncbi:MAG: VWA domain-containing protein [Burkholderiales bacterium]|nr:VWA domain-containing protein [Burkholderiales bacterium]